MADATDLKSVGVLKPRAGSSPAIGRSPALMVDPASSSRRPAHGNGKLFRRQTFETDRVVGRNYEIIGRGLYRYPQRRVSDIADIAVSIKRASSGSGVNIVSRDVWTA